MCLRKGSELVSEGSPAPGLGRRGGEGAPCWPDPLRARRHGVRKLGAQAGPGVVPSGTKHGRRGRCHAPAGLRQRLSRTCVRGDHSRQPAWHAGNPEFSVFCSHSCPGEEVGTEEIHPVLQRRKH